MFRRFEHLKKTNDISVTHLFKYLNLLQDFLLLIVVLHKGFINSLDGYNLPGKFVDAEGHLTEGSFPNKLDEFVVVNTGHRDFRSQGEGEVPDIGN